jgi:hypothetical protein
MSAVQSFNESVETHLADEVKAANVAGFDFSALLAILLPLLLDALTGLLDGCLSNSKQDLVAARLKDRSFFRSYMIRRTLREADCPQQHVAPCCNAVCKTLDDMTESDATALVNEVQTGLHEWDFV